ncbi:cysteine-rich CWC family protein [Piscinibacter sakaiensis]|uniref:cysteine-rich CWC family protein n=1 Tax=Piscinibacter sakaiensis TaxID=1547922 RepID=UPI003AACF542
MTSQPSEQTDGGQPLSNTTCPLCGGPNGCAPAACGRFDVDCWCRDVEITQATLARIPPAERGRSCICARCAAAAR